MGCRSRYSARWRCFCRTLPRGTYARRVTIYAAPCRVTSLFQDRRTPPSADAGFHRIRATRGVGVAYYLGRAVRRHGGTDGDDGAGAGVDWLRNHHIPVHALSTVLVLIFGGATLLLHNSSSSSGSRRCCCGSSASPFSAASGWARAPSPSASSARPSRSACGSAPTTWRVLDAWSVGFYALSGRARSRRRALRQRERLGELRGSSGSPSSPSCSRCCRCCG